MIEVIVALALMGITCIAVFGVLRACSRAAHHSRMLTKSVLLAESLLAKTTVEEKPVFGLKNGEQDFFRWKVEVAPTEFEDLGAVRVEVNWMEQQREQEYQLCYLMRMKSSFEGN